MLYSLIKFLGVLIIALIFFFVGFFITLVFYNLACKALTKIKLMVGKNKNE